MVLKDLRNGDKVKIRSGSTFEVFRGSLIGDNNSIFSLSYYTKDMTSNYCNNKMFDIVSVTRASKVIWRR